MPSWAPKALLILAACSLVLTGIVGVGRSGRNVLRSGFIDYHITVEAGRALRDGVNAYVPSAFEPYLAAHAPGVDATSPYSYPPHATTLFAAISALPGMAGAVAWLLLLLLCVVPSAVAVADIARAGPERGGEPLAGPGPWICAALFVANPVASHILWLGQPALLACCGLFLMYLGERRGQAVVTGLGLALASVKPQLSLVFGVTLLLDRRWRPLAVGAVVMLVLSLYPLAVFGPGELVRSFLARLSTHATWGANMPGSESNIGVRNLLYTMNVDVPGLEIVAVLAAVVVWRLRARLRPEDRFALLLGATLLFMPNQDSAYVLLVALVSALWPYAKERPRLGWAMLALGVVFMLPRRLVRLGHLAFLNQWRTLVTAAFVALLVWAIRERLAAAADRARPAEEVPFARS
jgi:hypothetical protein